MVCPKINLEDRQELMTITFEAERSKTFSTQQEMKPVLVPVECQPVNKGSQLLDRANSMKINSGGFTLLTPVVPLGAYVSYCRNVDQPIETGVCVVTDSSTAVATLPRWCMMQ